MQDTTTKPVQPLVGGQAVIEGVMMRGPETVSTAVRRPDGSIVVRSESFLPLSRRSFLLALPVLRGAAGVVEMLVLGIRMLEFSAHVSLSSGDEVNGERKGMTSVALGITMAGALAIGLALFLALPVYAATALFTLDQQPLLFNLAAGAIRITVLLVYLAAIGRMPDICRVFQYHGAEHKVVAAHEAGVELTVEHASGYSRLHPRCGTSFLLVVVLLSIILFAMVDAVVIASTGSITLLARLAYHFSLIPLVGGIAYELIRFSARHATSPFGRWIVAPGLWLQRITTREPDGSQLEVAIVALRSALGEETESTPEAKSATEAA